MEDPVLKAQRYAEAFLALAEAAGALDRMRAELPAAVELLDSDGRVRELLSDDLVRPEGKRDAVERLLRGRAHPALHHLLLTLVELNETRILPRIAEAFFGRVARLGRRVSGEVVSPVPLPDAQVAEIARETGLLLDKDVDLRLRIDRSLLGGLVVKVGDFVLDGTIDRQLEAVRRALFATPLPPPPPHGERAGAPQESRGAGVGVQTP